MTSFSERAKASAWLAGRPGLVDTVTVLHDSQVPRHLALGERAAELAQPGPVDPRRLMRHAAAASVSRALRTATGLPAAVASRRPLTDPGGWVRDAAVEAFVDQLALGGPASAELARLIEGAGELFPEPIRRELGRRDIRAVDVPPEVAQRVVTDAFHPTGRTPGLPPVHLIRPTPLTGTPVSSLHQALAGAEPLLVRVRRPRIARYLVSDSRLAAGAAGALARLMPDGGPIAPLGFVRLALRQHLESIDLRFDALGLAELGLILEDRGLDGLVVTRPEPGLIRERALGIDPADGTPLTAWSRPGQEPALDLAAVVPALVAVTIESAIAHGVFWADPAPEHLLVRPDGRLGLIGVGVLGRFTPELRLAGVRTVKAVLTGDFAGMLDGLRAVGAIGPDIDTAALVADLAANARLDPMQVLLGGESSLLASVNALVGVLLSHRVEPPIEVTLLLRTLFALGRLLGIVAPGGAGLTGALMGLLPRLPALLADAEAEADTDPADPT